MSHHGPSEIRVVGSLALLYVFRMLGLFMVFPIMMLFGRDYSDATPMLLGVALGLYGVTQALFQIPMGLLSDVWGRKQVIGIGLALFALGSLVGALTESVWGLLVARLLQGTGAIAAAILALVGDLTSDKNRTKSMAIIGVSIGLSFAVALFLGPVLASSGGLSRVFWVSFGLAILGMLIVLFVVPSPPPKSSEDETPPLAILLKKALADWQLLRLNLSIFSLHFVLTAVFVMAPLLLEGAGLAGDSHWTFYMPVMLAAFIGMLPLMFLAERKKQMKPVMLTAIILIAGSIILLGQSGGSTLNWVLSLWVFFVAFNLLEATLPSLMSKLATPESKGTAMGVYSTCQFLGAALGGIVGGYAYGLFGYAGIVWVSLTICIIWLIPSFFIRLPQPVERT